MLGEVYCLLRVTHALSRPGPGPDEARSVRAVRLVAAAVIILNLLTTYPYRTTATWALVHSRSGIALSLVELVGAGLLARTKRNLLSGSGSVIVVVVGFVLLVLTYVGRPHVLFVAEMVTAVGFGLLLVGAVRALPAAPPTPAPAGVSAP